MFWFFLLTFVFTQEKRIAVTVSMRRYLYGYTACQYASFCVTACGASPETVQHPPYTQGAPEGSALQEQAQAATGSRKNSQGSQENPCDQRTPREKGKRNLGPALTATLCKSVCCTTKCNAEFGATVQMLSCDQPGFDSQTRHHR